MQLLTLISFLFFTALVGVITWILTRRDVHSTSEGYFLAGRTLTGGYIAGSLLLTNLSTEQLIGLNGGAFTDGLSVMAWEVIAALSLVVMGLYFLPRYLKSGIATIPEFLELRFNARTRTITSLIFIVSYAGILLPMILYTGAVGMNGILNVPGFFGITDPTTGLWLTVWLIGIIGSIYAIFGGLRTVAVSDTLNGFGLLVGGVLIAWLGFQAVNPEQPLAALETLREAHPEKFNSLGGPQQSVPFSTLFSGVLLLNLFYWSTNQQIIQRAFGASSLKEGQKGVLLAGVFKMFAPLILVIPGIIAFHLFGQMEVDGQQVSITDITTESIALTGIAAGEPVILHGNAALEALGTSDPAAARSKAGETVPYQGHELRIDRVLEAGVVITRTESGEWAYSEMHPQRSYLSPRQKDEAYGKLVQLVLPGWLAGFFAAAVLGAILSSFNSVLNSTATLFSLGVYKDMLHPDATETQVIHAGKTFGWIIAIASMLAAPLLKGQEGIFQYLQIMNGLYFIPIFAVMLVGLLSRRVPAFAANLALLAGFAVIALGYFVPALNAQVQAMHEFHFLGAVFVSLVALMLICGRIKPRETDWVQQDSKAVDLTPWKPAPYLGAMLVLIVLTLYILFADFSAWSLSS